MSLHAKGWIPWLAAVMAVHGVLLVLYHLPEAKPGLGDERMYLRAASAVAAEGSSGLGSFWPPAYAWFLAPLVVLGRGSVWLVQAAQTALLVGAAWLLRELVWRALEDRWTANLTALLVVGYPPLVAFAHYLWPEVLHLALMLATLVVLVRWGPGLAAAVAGGALLALCLQTKLLLLPMLPLLGTGLWWLWPPRRRLPALLALTVTCALGVLPTLVAQQRDFGRLMLANSARFGLWVSLNEVSRHEFRDSAVVAEYPRYMQSARSIDRREEIVYDKIVQTLGERGLWSSLRRQLGIQYFRLFGRDSFLTLQLEGGAVWQRGDGYRAGNSIAAQVIRWLSYAVWAAILAMAAWGVAVFPYRGRRSGWWVLGFLLIQCGLFLVLHVKTRYRIQMLPGLFFFAAYGAGWWRARRSGTDQPRASRRQWVSGLTLCTLLLYLAFGG